MARGLESNASIADYYIDARNDLVTREYSVDQESYLKKIIPEDVRAVLKDYLTDTGMGYLISKPTLTYNQPYMLLFLTAIGAIFLGWHLMSIMHLHFK